MYSDSEIFVYDVERLSEIISNPTAGNLISASAILRRIFMDDGVPLIHKVARLVDLKPRFKIYSGYTKDSFEDLHKALSEIAPLNHLYQNPDPSISPAAITREVGLDEFLGLPFHYAEGKSISVKDIINYCANVGGGVHKGEPKKMGRTTQEPFMKHLIPFLYLAPPILFQAYGISSILRFQP
ncbi:MULTISPECIES: hypothetical protein [unclassified Methylobacterium]|uniref:hypothetical protein n=1 Tax=unclassified Methylobacterium TaxID=2615210 RepID=UPI000B127C67|nr:MULTISPECIES: hypothetical protein [unclassified Methylobacterium]